MFLKVFLPWLCLLNVVDNAVQKVKCRLTHPLYTKLSAGENEQLENVLPPFKAFLKQFFRLEKSVLPPWCFYRSIDANISS